MCQCIQHLKSSPWIFSSLKLGDIKGSRGLILNKKRMSRRLKQILRKLFSYFHFYCIPKVRTFCSLEHWVEILTHGYHSNQTVHSSKWRENGWELKQKCRELMNYMVVVNNKYNIKHLKHSVCMYRTREDMYFVQSLVSLVTVQNTYLLSSDTCKLNASDV
jgi:hypothetical protein